MYNIIQFFDDPARNACLYSFLNGILPQGVSYSSQSNKTIYDSAGKLVYAPVNMLTGSTTLGTQSVTVTEGQDYTLSFYGTGSVVLSEGGSGSLTGTDASTRVSLSFTAGTSSVTFTVSGEVSNAQLEPTSYDSPHLYNETTSAACYGPRFDNDPLTSAIKGVLIEESRTNAIPHSMFGEPSRWTQYGTTLTANSATAPNNLMNAALLTETTGSGTHGIIRFGVTSYTAGDPYTKSYYVKAGTATVAQLMFNTGSFASNNYANFDLTTGSIGTYNAVTPSIEAVGDGWYRISITGTAINTYSSTSDGYLLLTNNNTSASNLPTYTGTSLYLYVFGEQLEAGASATSYIPTYSASATRAADDLSFTIPPGVTRLRCTLDDDSTQDITGLSSGDYHVPTNLDRSHIKTIKGYTS
ncbi:MAG: hypothetical protein PHE27_04265 [Alphaproteobacteria bacterium]|nr:hypothetical protein [Alphaproteobacteria bacterium]